MFLKCAHVNKKPCHEIPLTTHFASCVFSETSRLNHTFFFLLRYNFPCLVSVNFLSTRLALYLMRVHLRTVNFPIYSSYSTFRTHSYYVSGSDSTINDQQQHFFFFFFFFSWRYNPWWVLTCFNNTIGTKCNSITQQFIGISTTIDTWATCFDSYRVIFRPSKYTDPISKVVKVQLQHC